MYVDRIKCEIPFSKLKALSNYIKHKVLHYFEVEVECRKI